MELKKKLFYMQRRHLFMDLKIFIRNCNKNNLPYFGFSDEDSEELQKMGETCKVYLNKIRKMKIKTK